MNNALQFNQMHINDDLLGQSSQAFQDSDHQEDVKNISMLNHRTEKEIICTRKKGLDYSEIIQKPSIKHFKTQKWNLGNQNDKKTEEKYKKNPPKHCDSISQSHRTGKKWDKITKI